MGLFGNVFKKKDSEYFKNKGMKFLEKREYIDALYLFEDGLKKADKLDDKTFFQKNIKSCRKNIAENNLKLALTYLDAGDKEQAYDFATNCLRYTEDKDIIEKANNVVNKLDQEELEEKLVIYDKDEKSEVVDIDLESYFEILKDNYPEFLKKEIEDKPQLKEILVYLNQGNLENASSIENIENSAASNYLKALYYSLTEEYKKSLEYYKLLIKEKRDLLDDERWIEIINVIDKSSEGEEIISKLMETQLSVNLSNAVATYLINRNNLEKAKEITENALKRMNSDNYNLYLVGNSGLIYFMLEDYEKACEQLKTVRNASASSGHYVFSTEYGIPLILSLEKTEKFDEAFEIVLHFMKAIENEKIKEIGIRLEKNSKREDLKKQFNLLI